MATGPLVVPVGTVTDNKKSVVVFPQGGVPEGVPPKALIVIGALLVPLKSTIK